MGNHQLGGTAVPIGCLTLLCLLIFFLSVSGIENNKNEPHGELHEHDHGNEEEEALEKKSSSSVMEMLLNRMMFFSTSTFPWPPPPPPRRTSYWNKAKTILNRVQAHFFPPNLDFRGSGAVKEAKRVGGAGEKVKEAAVKSFGESKATVEDSAKSAAKLAGEAVHRAAEKVMKSFPDKGGAPVHPQAEL